jgi:hypothetical protein
MQGIVIANADGDYEEAFEPLTDSLLQEYLNVRDSIGYTSPISRKSFLSVVNPFPANLSDPEFVPTNSFQLIRILNDFFPNHTLIASDFHSLPESVPGVDAPVVQTRYKKSMVPCSTYLVQPGLFDIFFPTNFQLLAEVYRHLTHKNVQTCTHREFVSRYADLNATMTKSGENPLLQYYENVSFIISE